jgi:hypothetical protein
MIAFRKQIDGGQIEIKRVLSRKDAETQRDLAIYMPKRI